MNSVYHISGFLTVLISALIAGFFYSYACSVMPALATHSDKNFVQTMQSINNAVLNPVFYTSFFGTLLILPLQTFFVYQQGNYSALIALSIASLLYIIGVFGVTEMGNVPLNNMLGKINLETIDPQILHQKRIRFETQWNRFNLIRTICSIIVLGLTIFSQQTTSP